MLPTLALALMLPAAPVPKVNVAVLQAAFGTIPMSDDFKGTFDGGRLTLEGLGKARPGFIDDGKLAAFRTERDAKGDFTVEVLLLTAERPTQDSPKHDARCRSGLYIRGDTETVCVGKFVRVATSDDGKRTVHDESLWLQHGGSGSHLSVWSHDEPMRVRLVKTGNNVEVYVHRGSDGWKRRTRVETTLGDEVTVGVALLPEVNQKVKASFADFKLSTGK